MHRYNAASTIPRPQTMLQMRDHLREDAMEGSLAPATARSRVTGGDDHQAINIGTTNRNPEFKTNYICIGIPKSTVEYKYQSLQHKSNPHTRQNLQLIQKKYRQIRSNQKSPSLGLIDIQSNRGVMVHASVAMSARALISQEFNPLVKQKKTAEIVSPSNRSNRQKVEQKKSKEACQIYEYLYDERTLRSKSEKKQRNSAKSAKSKTSKQGKLKLTINNTSEIFMPEKQSETGYVLHKFQSKLKKKSLEDNLHVMATVLRKKVQILDKNSMMDYLHRVMTRNQKEQA